MGKGKGDYDAYTAVDYKKGQEGKKPRRLTPFGMGFLLVNLGLGLLACWILYGAVARAFAPPVEAVVVPTAVPVPSDGGVNVTVNNNLGGYEPMPPHVQVVEFTNMRPDYIGHRYRHGGLIIAPLPCAGTTICAFRILPMEPNNEYCILYRRVGGASDCVPVDPSKPYVEINVTP